MKHGWIIVLAILLAACATTTPGPTLTYGPTPTPAPTATPLPTPVVATNGQIIKTPFGDVYRFYDAEAGTICYLMEKTEVKTDSNSSMDSGKGLGIGVGTGLAMSSLPIEATWLTKEVVQ